MGTDRPLLVDGDITEQADWLSQESSRLQAEECQQTRVEAGEFLVMAEVPADRSGEFQLLLESAGGEEVHTTEMTLPRPCPGKCNDASDLSPEVRSHLSEDAQKTFIERYNTEFDQTQDPTKAEHAAWDAIHQQYEEDEHGIWSKQKVTV